MRVLVTGATGFICHVLVRRLAAQGHEAIAVGRQRADGSDLICWDLSENAPTSLPSRIDAVVHGAQSRHYRAFPDDAHELFAVNTIGTFKLLDYAVRAGAKHFCLLSSGTVYEPFERGLDEEAPLAPTSMLGGTKLSAEAIARPFTKLFPISILRIFTPYGPGQKSRLIPDLIRRVSGGIDVQLAADGQGARLAPIYVDDLCSIIEASVTGQWSGTINVASPHPTSIRQISEIVAGILGKEPKFEIGTGSAIDLVPPVQRLLALMNLDTHVPLEEGLARTVAATTSPG